jgi:hypothetical protein
MVSVLSSSAVDHGIKSLWVKRNTINLVFAASLLNMQH